jgi:hypothetical protein
MTGLILLVSWHFAIGRSLLFSVLINFADVVISYFMFCMGLFVPVTAPIAASLFIFGAVSIIRFVYTTNRNELNDMIAARVFSAKQIESLKYEMEWMEPRVIKNAVIMTLFPRKLPDFGTTKAEAERYTSIYNKYLALVYAIVEKNDGNHINLSMDGVLGFWNVPHEEKESVINAYACAKESLGLVHQWQSYIDRVYGKKNKRYFASLDICLHICECYAGCIGTGNIIDYSLSGDGVNFAIETALHQTTDRLNTITVTEKFYKELASSGAKVNEELRKSDSGHKGIYRLVSDWKSRG